MSPVLALEVGLFAKQLWAWFWLELWGISLGVGVYPPETGLYQTQKNTDVHCEGPIPALAAAATNDTADSSSGSASRNPSPKLPKPVSVRLALVGTLSGLTSQTQQVSLVPGSNTKMELKTGFRGNL